MSPFPRSTYEKLSRYEPDRRPIEVDLSDNTSRWGAHPAALRVAREASDADLVRYPEVYSDRLRAAVAARFGVPVECVSTGCGSDDLIDSAFRASGEPGERIAYLAPTFSMVETFARMNGMTPLPLPLDGSDPQSVLSEGTALVYICRPNNPTGSVIERSWIERLSAAVEEEGPIVLLDEAYADFADDDFLGYAAGSKRLLVLRTLSKAYGLAGLRVGFAVGPAKIILEVDKSRGPYKVSRLAESAAVAALEDEEGWVPTVVQAVKRERARLIEELQRRGQRPLESSANFVLLPLPELEAGTVTRALREKGVAVRPFRDLPGIGDAIRISIGPPEQMNRFLRAWDEVSPGWGDRSA